MSRRSRRQSDAAVTLFPFLAVLICTMGSLIVLLVVVVQQAGKEIPDPESDTATVSQELPPDVEQQRLLEDLREDLGWQAEMLTQSREETLRRLKEQQAELSRAEDQTRQIKAELDQLYAESQNLDNVHQQQTLTAEQIAAEKAALQQRIDEAALRLAQAQEAAERKKRQYALVPYEGPNGTQRRPIYIECFNDRVILQPEGVILKSSDFLPPVNADNALASAIRAIREYYLNHGIVRTSTEPYPLIVVRPNGASAFAACRTALSGWDDEFGYELLPAEMELAYPPVDAQLRELLERTVDEARWRKQQRLVPEQREMVLSVDRHTGGFVRDGGGHGDALSQGNGSGKNGTGRGGVFESATPGASGGVASGSDDANRGSAFEGFGTSSLAAAGTANGGGELASGSERGAAENGESGSGDFIGEGGAMQPGSGELGGAGNGMDEFAAGGPSVALAEGDGGDGGSAGQVHGEGLEPSAGNGEGESPGDGRSFDALAGVGETGQSGMPSAAASGAAGGSAGSASQPANGQAGDPSVSLRAGTPSAMRSIARSQGANWALPGGSNGAIAIQRPVNLRCDAASFDLLPEAGTDQTLVKIPCTDGTESAVREMVSALWTRVDGWGIAGTGAYWKPVIEVVVTPEGESRYADLAALLEDSGLIVIRR